MSVLVLCATGKMGFGVSRGLKDSGLDVFGTTRNKGGKAKLEKIGVKPIIANYIVREDVDRALRESGAKQLVFLTDYFLAAGSNARREEEQGKMIIDAAKAADVSFVVFLSVGDVDKFSPEVKHILAKAAVEKYLLTSGLKYSILRPVAFFEKYAYFTSPT